MDETVTELAARQYGVFSRMQARGAGLSCAVIARRIEQRRWLEITKRVYRIAGTPESAESLVMATILSAGPAAVAGGSTALALHRVRDFELLPVRVIVGRRPHRLALAGVVETFHLPEGHRTVAGGIPTATVARAIFDLAASLGPRRLARVVDAALAARRVTVPELWAVVDELGERGRSGSPKLRAVLGERAMGYRAPTTALESRFLELLTDHAVPLPERQVRLGGRTGWIGTVDFAWHAERLVVETDGGAFHDSITDREADERRDRALEAAGWTVLRFNWNDVTRRPTSVVRTVQRALAVAA